MKSSQVWMTPEQEKLLKEAAAVELRPLTQFLLTHGLRAAKRILKKKLDTIAASAKMNAEGK